MEDETLELQLQEVQALLDTQIEELAKLRKIYHNAYNRTRFLQAYRDHLKKELSMVE